MSDHSFIDGDNNVDEIYTAMQILIKGLSMFCNTNNSDTSYSSSDIPQTYKKKEKV